MEGYSTAAEYSETAANSAGKSAEKLAIYQESLEAKTAKATAAFENFSMTILDSRFIGGFMDLATGVLNFATGLDGVPAKIVTYTAAIAALIAVIKSASQLKVAQNFIGIFSGLGRPKYDG